MNQMNNGIVFNMRKDEKMSEKKDPESSCQNNCKTWNKKISVYMLNFCVASAFHDMLTLAEVTPAGSNSQENIAEKNQQGGSKSMSLVKQPVKISYLKMEKLYS